MYKSVRILTLLLFLVATGGCESQQSNAPSDAVAENANQNNATDSSTPVIEEAPSETTVVSSANNVLIFGDSITAGYGLDEEQAFPALLQDKLDQLGWDFNVINGGLSGDTSAGGLRRINWMLREPIDVLVLELGGNDGLRGTSPQVTKQNLQAIIDEVRSQNDDVRIILAGMQIPPNLGQEYTTQFRDVFPSLAEENDADLIPFLLENVGGIPELNLPDGIHPTAEGHQIVAENVWKVLKPVLSSLREAQVSP